MSTERGKRREEHNDRRTTACPGISISLLTSESSMYGVHTGERRRGAPSPRSHLTGKAYLEETGRTPYRDRWHLGKGRERRGKVATHPPHKRRPHTVRRQVEPAPSH